jgi:mono/diheme cytochrome c family protein
MKVKDIMTTDVKTCTPETTVAAAANLMWEGDCGILPHQKCINWRKTMARILSVIALMATLALGFTARTSAQQTTPQPAKPTIRQEPAQRIDSIKGEDTFAAYCAVCHGRDAKGHGPAAPALKMPPADLTTIAKRHNGKFSAVDVQAKILGQNVPVTAHGPSDMPIWGPIFRSLSGDRSVETMRVQNLVGYLESIQEK